jgi:hypothetical protein
VALLTATVVNDRLSVARFSPVNRHKRHRRQSLGGAGG